MIRRLTIVLLLLALPSSVLAVALVAGVGVIRQGPPMLVALSAALLVGLPAAGIGSIVRGRLLGVLAGLVLWSWLVISGFSLYFPGERAEALAAGTGVLTTPLRLSVSPGLIMGVERYLPSLAVVREPPVRVTQAPTMDVPLSHQETPDGVVLPFEGQGRTMAVPITIEGAGEPMEHWMLFDTGATLTTLNAQTVAELGLVVPQDAPEVSLRTASGEQTAQVFVLDRIWIGGLPVEGVTIALCEACADDQTAGLLGLNVSGRFRVTVDTADRTLTLQPRATPDHGVDLSPWVTVEATAVHWSDGRVEVEVSATSISERPISNLQVEVRCEDTFAVELHALPPRGEASATVSLPLGANCEGYAVALVGGQW